MHIKSITKAIIVLIALSLSSCSATKNCELKPSVEVKDLPQDLKTINRDNVVGKGEVACSF